MAAEVLLERKTGAALTDGLDTRFRGQTAPSRRLNGGKPFAPRYDRRQIFRLHHLRFGRPGGNLARRGRTYPVNQ